MNFDFVPCPEIPTLAWGAVLESGADSAVVYHGEQVETQAGGFFEGAWNGPVDVASALDATVVCGSGGACDGAAFKFWASTDNTFPIYSIRKSGSLFVSNSPVFVQVLAGEQPDLSYPFYHDDFIRIVRAGFSVRGRMRTASGNSLRLQFGHIMSISRNLVVSFDPHPACAPFADYETYHELLATSVEEVLANAQSGKRRFPYRPLACCSRGYDANACAALAARAGCEEAMTFICADQDGGGPDNGEDIAVALKLRCTTGDKDQFRHVRDLAEFCIVPHPMSSPYTVFGDILDRRIMISGHAGDTVWGPHRARIYDDGRVAWLRSHSGYSLCEYRLRIGFLLFPPVFIGSAYNRMIHRISCSEEMEPWRVGGGYDRPIPRRILEEAGVARHAFGMEKHASVHVRFDRPSTQEGHTGLLYRKFMDNRSAMASPSRDLYWKCRYRWRMFLLYRFAPVDERVVEYTRTRQLFSFLNNRPALFEWYCLFGFQFCFQALRSRYEAKGRSGEGLIRSPSP